MDAFGLHVWGLEAPWRLEAAIWRLGGWMWGAGGPEGGSRAEVLRYPGGFGDGLWASQPSVNAQTRWSTKALCRTVTSSGPWQTKPAYS